MDTILAVELVGSLQSYEYNLPKMNKSKSMALKSVNNVDEGVFDDEITATEFAHIAKHFQNF